jgi:predicted DNA-binding transcriptional regulator AlpA
MSTQAMANGTALLSRVQLAEKLNCSLQTLDRMRRAGRLPKPYRIGRGPGRWPRWDWDEVLRKLGRGREGN